MAYRKDQIVLAVKEIRKGLFTNERNVGIRWPEFKQPEYDAFIPELKALLTKHFGPEAEILDLNIYGN